MTRQHLKQQSVCHRGHHLDQGLARWGLKIMGHAVGLHLSFSLIPANASPPKKNKTNNKNKQQQSTHPALLGTLLWMFWALDTRRDSGSLSNLQFSNGCETGHLFHGSIPFGLQFRGQWVPNFWMNMAEGVSFLDHKMASGFVLDSLSIHQRKRYPQKDEPPMYSCESICCPILIKPSLLIEGVPLQK